MTIPTQVSLSGFIASPPQLNFTGKGAARFYARIGVEHFRKEPGGTFTRLDSTYHDLVMFGASAESAYAGFKVGDQFVTSGYIHEYKLDRNGTTESREEFVARRIGHDLARTKYTVDRSPSQQPAPPAEQVETGAVPPQTLSI
jgi:single-strand DNA-binding protein